VVALHSLTASVIEAHAFGWSSVPIRAATAPLPSDAAVGFFGCRTFTGATLVGFLLNMMLNGSLFVLGLYFQRTRHWSACLSGIALLPLPVVLGIANVLASPITAGWERPEQWPSVCCSAPAAPLHCRVSI
jgi:hypothetical protein